MAALLPALAQLQSTLVASLPALAGPTDQASGIAAGLRLDPQALGRITGTPPAPGSREEASDMAILHWVQRHRTPEMVAVTWLLLDRNLSIFSSAVGAELGTATPALKAGLESFMAPVNAAYKGDQAAASPWTPLPRPPGAAPLPAARGH